MSCTVNFAVVHQDPRSRHGLLPPRFIAGGATELLAWEAAARLELCLLGLRTVEDYQRFAVPRGYRCEPLPKESES